MTLIVEAVAGVNVLKVRLRSDPECFHVILSFNFHKFSRNIIFNFKKYCTKVWVCYLNNVDLKFLTLTKKFINKKLRAPRLFHIGQSKIIFKFLNVRFKTGFYNYLFLKHALLG